MRGFISIAVRELIDRRAVLVAAVAAALVPVVAPLLPGLTGYSAADVRGTTAWVMALGLSWVLAAFLGSSMVASELSEGRMGFFYSRPVSHAAIWGGKVLASFGLVMCAQFLVLLPTALMPSSRPYFDFGRGEPAWALIGLLFGVPLFLLLATHAISVMWRARSAWDAIDVAVFLVLAFAVWTSVSPLFLPAPRACGVAVLFVLVSLVVALAVAGAVQVAVGRTDVRRSHRALSIALWGSLLLVVLVVASFSWWMFAVEPDDLVTVASVDAAPAGAWIVVDGLAPGRFDFAPRFLFNTATGASVRITSGEWRKVAPVAFSGDGHRAAWLHPSGLERWRLVYADLGDGKPDVRHTSLFFGALVGLELSGRGDRIAVLEQRVTSVYELQTGELLIAAPVDDGAWVRRARWVTNDVIRLFSEPRHEHRLEPVVVISEVNLDTGAVHQTGTLGSKDDVPETGGVVNRRAWNFFDPPRDRFLDIRRLGDRWRWSIRNGRTGALITDLGLREDRGWAAFLADGRLVEVVVDMDGAWLESLSVNGEVENRIRLGDAGRVVFGGEVSPGVLTLSVSSGEPGGWNTSGSTAMAVDITAGTIREIPGAVLPAGCFNLFRTGLLGNGRLFHGRGGTALGVGPCDREDEEGAVDRRMSKGSKGSKGLEDIGLPPPPPNRLVSSRKAYVLQAPREVLP